jgi:hypothetical protein
MGMNQERLYSKIMASYATGVRGDLDIADFQKLDTATAHVLLEFEPSIGKPNSDDIERYFGKMFEGKIVPVMSTASIKPMCVSIIAKLNVPTRAFEESEDKAKMTAVVAGMMYLDNQLGDVWQVKQDAEGKKVLAKESKENIDQIIAARRNRMFITKSSTVSLASVAAAKSHLGAGCVVKAWHNGKMQQFEIMAAGIGGFKAKDEAGKEVMLASEGIVDLKKMADEAPNEDAKLMKYFAEAYGDKGYAKQLVKAK